MARMPGAVFLGEHGKLPMHRYDVVCVHTIVGFAPAHAAHFSVTGDGRIYQSRDTRYQSGANLEGNPRIIAVENEDHGPEFPHWTGSNVPPLTDAQVEANARILRWAHETHGVPLQLCPDSRPASKGLAYHRQGIDGNFTGPYQGRVPGGEKWTKSFGKVCPGDKRISQLPSILKAAKPSQGGFMADLTEAQQDEIYEKVRHIAASVVPHHQVNDARFRVQTLVGPLLAPAAEDAVNKAFVTSGSDVREQFAGNSEVESLVELALRRSESFSDLVAAVTALNDKVDELLATDGG